MESKISSVVTIYAYCLLQNHFHILVRTKSEMEIRKFFPEKDKTEISKIISQQFSNMFNSYTQAINKHYGRTGKLFELPFRRKVITNDEQLANTIGYIHNNPVKHGIILTAENYRYSSLFKIKNRIDDPLLSAEAIKALLEISYLHLMNYLAHSFLTFTDGQIVGQFLEDFIRNRDRFSFPKDIQDGITLHRAIDTFTDSHPAIHEAKKVFAPLVRLYAGAFVDVAMDYFVANDMSLHSKQGWKDHSSKVYRVLNNNYEFLPENFRRMLSKMEEGDWLYNYRYEENIGYSMRNVLNKAKYLHPDIAVHDAFLKNKNFLQQCYDDFFPDLLEHAKGINALLQMEN